MILVGNGRVITRDAANPYIEDGAVLIEGDSIVAVGKESELRTRAVGASFVDAHGGVIMPGLVNCHTHIYSGLARGLSIKGCNPTNFLENLEQQWWKIDDNLDPRRHPRLSAYATILDSLRDGRDHDLRPPRELLRDPRLALCHQGRRRGARHPLLPVLRDLRSPTAPKSATSPSRRTPSSPAGRPTPARAATTWSPPCSAATPPLPSPTRRWT